MSRKLSPEDAQAVDMLLDKTQSAVGFAAGPQVDPARLNAVRAVLNLLDLMPQEQPSADLLARTMSRVSADQPAAAALPDVITALSGQQAHA